MEPISLIIVGLIAAATTIFSVKMNADTTLTANSENARTSLEIAKVTKEKDIRVESLRAGAEERGYTMSYLTDRNYLNDEREARQEERRRDASAQQIYALTDAIYDYGHDQRSV